MKERSPPGLRREDGVPAERRVRDESWNALLAWAASSSSCSHECPRRGGVARRGVGPGWQPSGKRTHLLYEIISNQTRPRMSPVWRRSGEAGLWGGGGVVSSRRQVGSSSQLFLFYVFNVTLRVPPGWKNPG